MSGKSRQDKGKALAEQWGMGDFWKEVTESFTQLGRYDIHPLTDGFTCALPPLKMPGLRWELKTSALYPVAAAGACHSVRLDESSKKIRITFFPVAIHLCEAQFKKQNEVIPFTQEPPPNAPQTDRVSEQWYCLLDAQEWAAHKDTLIILVSAVYTEWEARRKSN